MNLPRLTKKKHLTATKKITLCDLLRDVIHQNDELYPTFMDDLNTYITISHDQINYEIGIRGYHPYCRKQLYTILKKEEESGSLLVKRLASNVKAYSILQVVNAPKTPIKFKRSCHSPAISEARNTVGTATVGIPTAPKCASKTQSQPVSDEKNKKNQKNIYIDNKSNNQSLNKSYINFSDKISGEGKEEGQEPVLVRQLANLVSEHLGDRVIGFLNKQKSVWLHACYKKLGSTMDAFVDYLKQLRTRNWLQNQRWFGFKWIFTFRNIDKILSGELQDFVAEKTQGAFKGVRNWARSVNQPAEVLVVRPELERQSVIASYYSSRLEFPEGTTMEEIQAVADGFIKAGNYVAAELIGQAHPGVSVKKQLPLATDFIPQIAPEASCVEQEAEVLVVRPDLVRAGTIASHYHRTGELPEGTTPEEIKEFIDGIEKHNPFLARQLKADHLGIPLPASYSTPKIGPNFLLQVTKGQRNVAATPFGTALGSLLAAMKGNPNKCA